MYLAPLNEDFVYIEDEKKTWEEVERLERGIYEDGKKDGEKLGMEKGEKLGMEKGEKIGMEKTREGIALNMIKHGMDIDAIAQITGISHGQLEEIRKTGE